ncbi:MAG TPA: class I SAM-dependent methyltransferase [Actinocrinis sp.]|uniref:class I SAM-dependent methyltransferase n=1 Tax=Actinocrinis sp. TaxID=1920516 RepID=UPI002D2424E0|nr:class I SAM-dependent methyltransferase [Actinocrinis sp.]HZU56057.1 class I SAM-dependent methyltransferase [Actinocrinis sp.]
MGSTSAEAEAAPTLAPEILDYYARGGEESRLRYGVGRLELWRTQDILRRVLPEPGGRLLDVGGASGVHAEWLAADGWRVEVVDPVPLHVEKAGALPGVTARLGDVRALDAEDASVDVVLLLGPLYHLPEPAERHKALVEAARVVRPGGTVVAATINRHAALHDQLNRGGWFEPWRQVRLIETSATGRVDAAGGEFTTAYLHQPDEIAAEVAAAGLTVSGQYGIEGAAWLFGGIDACLDDEAKRAELLKALRIAESEPTLLGISAHLLTVGVRP